MIRARNAEREVRVAKGIRASGATVGRWARLDARAGILALLICLPALIPTLRPGWFEGHDDLHIYRLVQYDLALRDGQIPPRWFPDISAGFGNPHPIYYAPLFYYVAEAFHLTGAGVVASLKGALVVFMIVAALGMYALCRPRFGPQAAVLAATAYTYAPYHLLDLYVRKAFSEFTVFSFLPLLLLAFERIRDRGTRHDIMAGALAMAAMSTSHTITTMMVPALLGAWVILLGVRGPEGGPIRLGWLPKGAVAAGLGYAIAGFFLVPAFLERAEINLAIYTEAYVQYQKHFVFPRQLIWWPWGFGMSLDGLADKMSFRLGLMQIAGTLLAAAGLRRLRRTHPGVARGAVFWIGATAVAVFMMLPLSAPVWAMLPPLRFVQFPWRFLTLTTISTAWLCGAAFLAWGPPAGVGTSEAPRRRRWIACLVCCALFVAGSAAGGMLSVNLRVPHDRIGFEEKPYNNMIDRGAGAAPETFDGAYVRSHTLRWIDHLPPGVSFMERIPEDLARPRVEIESGSARVSDVRERSAEIRFHVAARAPSRVRVNIYRFPGWTARVNGVPVPLIDPQGRDRVCVLEVPEGDHEVALTFERTPPRRLGDLLTLAGLAALAALGLWPARRP